MVTQNDENDENDVLANIPPYVYRYVMRHTRGFIGELVMVVMCNDNSADSNELQVGSDDVLSGNMNTGALPHGVCVCIQPGPATVRRF
jgi:hypothetical protein